MLFNTIEYFIFLPIVLIVSLILPRRYRAVWLLAASYYFYMSWHAEYAILILLSTVVDFGASHVIHRSDVERTRKTALLVSIVVNLGMLFTFKYWNFFADSLNTVAATVGSGSRMTAMDVLLPVGISFYTFQTMAYTIDVYRRRFVPEPSFGKFALYVSYFPQLVAGPIERPGHLLPQLNNPKRFNWDDLMSGIQLILWGLFKKVVIADNLAVYVDAIYNNVGQHGGASYLIATYAFAFQIYCDFSGYTDIARGTARLFGVDLMKNFRQPYFATSITDFWRRWHISLSTWLRDYLYISLGGNRKGRVRTHFNLMLTMLLGGLWHGASWNFVIWGGLHGALLIASRQTLAMRDAAYAALGIPDGIKRFVRIVLTFHLVCLSWVFFRARTVGDAFEIIRNVIGGQWGELFLEPVLFVGAIGVPVLIVVQLLQVADNAELMNSMSRPTFLRWASWYAMLTAIVLLGMQTGSQFIYFQF